MKLYWGASGYFSGVMRTFLNFTGVWIYFYWSMELFRRGDKFFMNFLRAAPRCTPMRSGAPRCTPVHPGRGSESACIEILYSGVGFETWIIFIFSIEIFFNFGQGNAFKGEWYLRENSIVCRTNPPKPYQLRKRKIPADKFACFLPPLDFHQLSAYFIDARRSHLNIQLNWT